MALKSDEQANFATTARHLVAGGAGETSDHTYMQDKRYTNKLARSECAHPNQSKQGKEKVGRETCASVTLWAGGDALAQEAVLAAHVGAQRARHARLRARARARDLATHA